MAIEVRPATEFDDVAAVVGPKNPASNVCFCLSYRIGSKENVELKGTARGDRVRGLCREDPPPGVLAYDGERNTPVSADATIAVSIERTGPRLIDVDATLALAARDHRFDLDFSTSLRCHNARKDPHGD